MGPPQALDKCIRTLWLWGNLKCCCIPTFLWRALHLSLTRGRLLQRQEGEDGVTLGALQTHFHRLVVLHCRADVPVAVGDRYQGAEVGPSDVLVEEKANQFAVGADGAQLLLVFHCLREERIHRKRFSSRKEERRRRAYPSLGLFKSKPRICLSCECGFEMNFMVWFGFLPPGAKLVPHHPCGKRGRSLFPWCPAPPFGRWCWIQGARRWTGSGSLRGGKEQVRFRQNWLALIWVLLGSAGYLCDIPSLPGASLRWAPCCLGPGPGSSSRCRTRCTPACSFSRTSSGQAEPSSTRRQFALWVRNLFSLQCDLRKIRK